MTVAGALAEVRDISSHESVQKDARKRYRAYFRHLDPEDKERFKNSACILSISVGQPYHEGKKFEATLRLVCKHFKKCIILVGDILQRHSINITNPSQSEQESYNVAKQCGARWIESNKRLFTEILKIPYTIVTWDHWLNHPEFPFYYNKICNLYEENTAYKNAVNTTIRDFFTRATARGHLLDVTKIQELSLKYILEECAALCLWVETQCEFEIYPTPRNPAIAFTYDNLIKPYHPMLSKPLSLNFNKIVYKSA